MSLSWRSRLIRGLAPPSLADPLLLLRRIHDPNIRLVYLAIFLLGTAYGMAIAVIALHLDARGFTKSDIGQLAAFFASGIVAMSLPVGVLLRRFSAKVVLTASLLGYAVTDRKSTRLNSSHQIISYAVFCLKKKKT